MTIAYLLTYSLQELPTAATDSTPNEILIRYDHLHAHILLTFIFSEPGSMPAKLYLALPRFGKVAFSESALNRGHSLICKKKIIVPRVYDHNFLLWSAATQSASSGGVVKTVTGHFSSTGNGVANQSYHQLLQQQQQQTQQQPSRSSHKSIFSRLNIL